MREKTKNRKLEDFTVLSNLIADPVWVVDEKGTCLAVNQAMSQVLGFSEQELVGKKASGLDFLDQENQGILSRNLEKRMNGLDVAPYEVKATAKNGETKSFEVKGKKIRYANKNVDLVILHDITEQKKKTEEIIRLSEEKYKNLFENAPDVIVTFDLTGKITSANNAILKFGFKENEIVGSSIFELVPKEYTQKMIAGLKNIAAGNPAHNEIEIITPIGKKSIEYNSNPIWLNGKVVGYQTIIIEVTERRKMEESLEKEQQELNRIIDSSPVIIFYKDKEGKFVRVNEAFAEALRIPKEKFLGKTVFDLYSAEIARGMAHDDLEVLESGRPKFGIIEQYESASGLRWVQTDKVPILDRNAISTGIVGFAQDITQRKKAEEALRESEEKYRKLFEESMDAIFVADTATGIIVDCNPAASKLIEREKSELVGQNQSILHPKDQTEEEFTGVFKQHLKDQTKTFETQIMLKTGEIRDFSVKGTIFELNGRKLIQEIFRDITERKQAEQKLQEAEKRYHVLFNQAPLGVLVIDPQTAKPVEFNDVAHTQLGYSRNEFSKLCISDFEAKEKPDEISAHLANMVMEGGGEFETEHCTKNGEIRNVLVTTRAVKLGGKTFLHCVFHDITEIRKVQKTLMESEAGYRQLVELAQEGIWALDNNFNTVFVNPHMAQMLGYTESEMIGKSIFDFLFKTDHEKTTKYLSQFKQGMNGNFEHEFMRKDGFSVNTSIAATQIKDDEGSCLGTLALVSDITLRKKMENELRQETQKLETITESVGVGLTIIGKDYHILWTNKVMKQIRGIPNLEGRTCYATYNYLDSVCPECGVKKVFEGKETDSREYMVFDREKGTPMWMQLIASPIKDKDGNVTGALELVLPITERKKAESSLKSSEENFRNLADQSPNIIFINQNGKVVYANTEAEQITGYIKEELYSSEFNFMDLIAPESKEFMKSQFIKHMKGEEVRPYEYKLISKKGQTKDVINSTKLIDYNGEPAILGIETDITESKKLKEKLEQYSKHLEDLVKERTVQLEQAQAQLVKSERLAAIGELAGMVGHDLRNPLTGIKNAAYYLKKKGATCPEAQAKEMLEIIDKAIDHSNKIINDLLDYSREMHLELTEIETSALLNEAVRMIQVPERIQIVNHVLGETWFMVDAGKIMRVFINLIKNAIDAVPEKGTLEITSRQIGGKVEIVFADTGTGIPDEVLPKLFSPLFTTKAQGMGFGLAICKRIIESHGGKITVKTAVNKGTTFTITLPIKPKVEGGGEKTWINMPESLLSTTTKA